MKPDIFDRIMSWKLLRPLQPIYQKYKEQLLYLFFGVLTTVVNLAVFALMVQLLGMNPLAGNVIAWIVGVAFAYVTNRIWVFQSDAAGAGIVKEALSFTTGRLATLGLEELILWVGIDLLGIGSFGVKLVAQVLVIVGNYVVSKLFVFKKC